ANAADRQADASLGSRRRSPRLRRRWEHGGAGDPVARSPSPVPPRRRGGLRSGRRLLAAVPRVSEARVLEALPPCLARSARAVAAGAPPRRARRTATTGAPRLRAAQPADLRPRDRVLARAASALVEPARRDRDRPAAADRAAVQVDREAQPARRRNRLHRSM